jgi:hypothetical protein
MFIINVLAQQPRGRAQEYKEEDMEKTIHRYKHMKNNNTNATYFSTYN